MKLSAILGGVLVIGLSSAAPALACELSSPPGDGWYCQAYSESGLCADQATWANYEYIFCAKMPGEAWGDVCCDSCCPPPPPPPTEGGGGGGDPGTDPGTQPIFTNDEETWMSVGSP